MIEDLSFRKAEEQRLNDICSGNFEEDEQMRHELLMDKAQEEHNEEQAKPVTVRPRTFSIAA
jgi:hypothetical protein